LGTLGELTEDGYTKRLQSLEDEFGHSSKSSQASDISTQLGKPGNDVKYKIQSLFGKKRAAPLPIKSTPKKMKLSEKSSHRKKITVICVDQKTFSLPSRKVRDAFVQENLVKETYISKNENLQDTMERFKSLFPKRALIPVDLSEEESLMNVIYSDSIYVRGTTRDDPGKKEVQAVSQTQQCSISGQSQTSVKQLILQGNQSTVYVCPKPTPNVIAKVVASESFNLGKL